ncbi:MAG: 23S rRNA (guanosine(2251)-2'-O)-methyltransferase RlmB [Anaerovoracaceae bacterium]
MRDTNEKSEMLIGRNAVLEALRSGREIEKIVMAQGTEGSVKKIAGMARDFHIPIKWVKRSALDKITDGVHQGVIAFVAAHSYCEVQDILEVAKERGEAPFIVILDGIEDPHNLGAILRSAECAGAHGLIIGKRRSAGMTETVAKASAGAIEYMRVARVTNIARTIDDLKAAGVWIAACDMGDTPYYEADLSGAIALVIGNEGSGIGRLVREKCDFTASIPMCGRIDSLNASNAAAILMFEVRRQRNAGKI